MGTYSSLAFLFEDAHPLRTGHIDAVQDRVPCHVVGDIDTIKCGDRCAIVRVKDEELARSATCDEDAPSDIVENEGVCSSPGVGSTFNSLDPTTKYIPQRDIRLVHLLDTEFVLRKRLWTDWPTAR